MQRVRLAASGLVVSRLCLGTMTFGEQTDKAEAHRILDAARADGVTFFDLAEMYPVPPKAETYGATETIFGEWLQHQPRASLIVASKIAGPNYNGTCPHIRAGLCALDRFHLSRAVDASLARLRTDYLDLYQTHWPDRDTPLLHQLEAMAELIESGRVRYWGVSNETPWGLMRILHACEQHGLPKPISVQNIYHLLRRDHEIAMAEVCRRENIALLGFSTLAMGLLTGKFDDGQTPEDARLIRYAYRFGKRYGGERVKRMAARYNAIARAAGLDPTSMAVAWACQAPTLTCPIPGVRRVEQWPAVRDGMRLSLSADVLDAIETAHHDQPNPVP